MSLLLKSKDALGSYQWIFLNIFFCELKRVQSPFCFVWQAADRISKFIFQFCLLLPPPSFWNRNNTNFQHPENVVNFVKPALHVTKTCYISLTNIHSFVLQTNHFYWSSRYSCLGNCLVWKVNLREKTFTLHGWTQMVVICSYSCIKYLHLGLKVESYSIEFSNLYEMFLFPALNVSQKPYWEALDWRVNGVAIDF